MTEFLYKDIKDGLFKEVDDEEYEQFPDRVQRHCMSNRHTEILGQFLDTHYVNEEVLKEILIRGFVWRIAFGTRTGRYFEDAT